MYINRVHVCSHKHNTHIHKHVYRSEWEEGMSKQQSHEASFLARREERIDENEAQLQHLRRRNMEDFNKIKIKLETDIQTLQQQIQQMKATFLLNAEKLEYNFQVCVCVYICMLDG